MKDKPPRPNDDDRQKHVEFVLKRCLEEQERARKDPKVRALLIEEFLEERRKVAEAVPADLLMNDLP